jgi:hypothetical protein
VAGRRRFAPARLRDSLRISRGDNYSVPSLISVCTRRAKMERSLSTRNFCEIRGYEAADCLQSSVKKCHVSLT